MILDNLSPQKYNYGESEGYEARSYRRLQDDLGVGEAGAEVVLLLRRQVIELQTYIRQLEAELNSHQASQAAHLALYRQEYFEAIWIESGYENEEM